MNHYDGPENKIFVGGLSWETDEERLKGYFSEFGEVVSCLVMKNQETGKSRGFGFVTFRDPHSVKLVLSAPMHQLDGRPIDPKECNPKNPGNKVRREGKHGNVPKIFLGGLPANITETQLKDYFSKHGKVTEVIIMYDQEKKKSRGFGFLSFENEDCISKLVAEHYVNINGKQVEVKRAEPQNMKSGPPTPNGNAHHHHPHHPGNMAMPPFYTMGPPWNMWPPQMPGVPPGMNPSAMNYQNYQNAAAWNPATAAACAAACAAAAATNSQGNWPGFCFPPQPPPPPHGAPWPGAPSHGPYAPHHAFQPPNSANSPAAGSNGHGPHPSSAGAPPPPPPPHPFPHAAAAPGSSHVASMSQNVPNMPGPPGPNSGGNFSHHESANGFPRADISSSFVQAASSAYNNTHNNFGPFGGGGPGGGGPGGASSMVHHPPPPPPGAPPGGPHHHHPGSEHVGLPPGMHQNAFNGALSFGSRGGGANGSGGGSGGGGSQNSGSYHPYRRA